MPEERYEGWVSVFTSGTDYEADIVRDRLDDAGIPAVVLTQRDHVFNLNVGSMAPVNVMVPPERAADAEALLRETTPTEEDLHQAALSSDPAADSAHDTSREAMLDSGIEEIRLSPPPEEPDQPV